VVVLVTTMVVGFVVVVAPGVAVVVVVVADCVVNVVVDIETTVVVRVVVVLALPDSKVKRAQIPAPAIRATTTASNITVPEMYRPPMMNPLLCRNGLFLRCSTCCNPTSSSLLIYRCPSGNDGSPHLPDGGGRTAMVSRSFSGLR